MAARPRPKPDRLAAAERLAALWAAVLSEEGASSSPAVRALVNSDQVAIRFCLPTQLLGKLVAPDLDVLCLQRSDGAAGRWDPRSFASKVVVPWNQANQNVLGMSADPYVSNPLRRPRLDEGLAQTADPGQWAELCDLLRAVQATDDPQHTEAVLRDVLRSLHERLRALSFAYLLPPRVSLAQAIGLTESFLAERSGGERGQAIVAALLTALVVHVPRYHAIRRGTTNAADAATGSAGDIECLDQAGTPVLVVEVKERPLSASDIPPALGKARRRAASELLLCSQGMVAADKSAIETAFAAAWASGTSIYHLTVEELMRGTLPLFGPTAIRTFVAGVGAQLDSFGSQPRHRQRWQALLDTL